MRRFTPLSAALAAVLGGVVSGEAVSQTQTTAPSDEPIATIVVTGSNIKRSGSDAPNPVQILSREELETSAKVTVADVLRSVSANTGNATNETTNNGWASGAAGIGLRGLSQKNTLVLLNGRRLANYGFPANGLSDTFVNLNALPMVAVERIDVLKDGASAVYGSDAVAGVVNIITRENYQGFEAGGSFSSTDEGGLDTQRARFLGGIGDKDSDGYNVLFSFEAYDRDRLDQDQRDLTRSGIYTDSPGGRWNGWTAKGARFLVNGASVPLLDAQGNCPDGMELTASAPIDGLPGNTCAINLAPYTTLIPSTERYQGYINGTLRINDNIDAFGEVIYSHIRGASIFGSSPYFTLEGGRFALNADSGLAEPVPAVLPAGNPYNPYGVNTQIEYTFFDLGQSVKTNRSDAYRVVAGVRGRGERWDWEASAFSARSKEEETVSGGFANRWGLFAALANGSYNLHDPSSTPLSVIDSIRLSTVRPADSRLHGADFKITGNLFDVPAGSVGFAAGVEWREEEVVSRNPWQIDAGLQIRPAIAEVDGKRNVTAAYAELNVPVLATLELQLAGRGDHYSDFGSAFSPKASLRWQPLDVLAVRGAASRGFRAPSLSENSASTNISYGSVVDPYDPDVPGSRQNPTFFTVGNSNLDPERTHSYNFGVVLTPWQGSSLSVDWYRIELDNLIGTDNTSTIVQNNRPGDVVRDARGKLVAVYNRYQNLSELTTSGIDVELRRRWQTQNIGEFGVTAVYTHVLDYRRPQTTGGPLVDYAGSNLGASFSLPQDKATTTVEWNIASVRTALTWYHTGGYDQKASAAASAAQTRVDAYEQFDLYTGWSSGSDNLTVYAKVENLFDEQPPYDASFPGIRAPYDFTQYDLRGRAFLIGLDYRL
ncbi:TonB-dependent receptor plug domain-containing protein [Peristeroidobacter agariperforans]|uniref:TonB-dependent receptor plug domain-containing protein n=1 Tax=Peristeroidobacter agariperforans TaxID=268404 RepID=UPI00101DBFB8|nr:TonB-dependent receptor [Peristeroidobacter agariperforans]